MGNRKKVIGLICVITVVIIFAIVLIANNQGNKENEIETSKSIENLNNSIDDIILPANILNEVTMITTRLEISCNSNGVALELEQTDVSINDSGNYVVTYNLRNNNTTNENKMIFFIYNENARIQSTNVTFSDSSEDIYQLIKIIQYLLQVKELNIPIEEANQVYAIFNDINMDSTWEEKIDGRTYMWMDSRGVGTTTDMQIFNINYNY